MAKISMPLQYERLFSGALDITSVHNSYEECLTYSLSPTAYSGQLIACPNADGTEFDVFVINSDKTLKKLGSSNIDEPVVLEWGNIDGNIENQTDLTDKLEEIDNRINDLDLFSGNYNDLINKPDIPAKLSDLNNDVGFITSAEISDKVNNDDPRLSDERNAKDVYEWAKQPNKPIYNASEVGALSDTTQLFSGDYNDLDNLPIIPTNLSDFTNDTGYITEQRINVHNDSLASHSDIRALIANVEVGIPSVDDFISDDSNNMLAKGADQKLFVPSINVPTKLSDLSNDAGYISAEVDPIYIADKPNIALKSELFSRNYNDLSNKPALPTKTSELDNDSGYITENVVETHNVSATAHDDIRTLINEIPPNRNFIQNPINLENEVTGVLPIEMVNTSSLFSGNYNDLDNKPQILSLDDINAENIEFLDGETFQEKYDNGELKGADGRSVELIFVDGETPEIAETTARSLSLINPNNLYFTEEV